MGSGVRDEKNIPSPTNTESINFFRKGIHGGHVLHIHNLLMDTRGASGQNTLRPVSMACCPQDDEVR